MGRLTFIPASILPLVCCGQDKPSSLSSNQRQLRYVFYANGGLRLFFKDGSIAGCPQCELLVSNLKLENYTSENFFSDRYTVEADGSLLIGGTDREFPMEVGPAGEHEWAMIDYRWVVAVEP